MTSGRVHPERWPDTAAEWNMREAHSEDAVQPRIFRVKPDTLPFQKFTATTSAYDGMRCMGFSEMFRFSHGSIDVLSGTSSPVGGCEMPALKE